MFAKFDYSLYEKCSVIKVMLYNNINDEYFNSFINEWQNIYKHKKNFILIFNTINVSIISIKYCIKMSKFISKLKEEKIQFLQKNIIIINNNIVKYMLNIIFNIQKPVAPVYLIELNDNTNIKIIKIINNEPILKNYNIITILP